jgi:hypothetical protein
LQTSSHDPRTIPRGVQNSRDLGSGSGNKIEDALRVHKTAPNFLASDAGQFALRCTPLRVSRDTIESLLESRGDNVRGLLWHGIQIFQDIVQIAICVRQY